MKDRILRPSPGEAWTAALFLVVAAVIVAAGCLNGITVPDFRGISLPGYVPGAGENLTVYFLDVGQGDSSLILFGNTTVLIDAGEIGRGDRVVKDLRALGVTRIDLLVATHPHSDHIGGMQEVLDAFPVTRVLDTGRPHPSALYEKFLDTIDRKNIRYTVAQQGETIEPGTGLRILVLSPTAAGLSDDLNENSIVLRVSYGTVDFLFTGDAGKEAEGMLVKTGYALDAEILKAGHHGSSHSTSPAFLSRVSPETAIISVGAGNPYGHPHTETLDMLDTAGVAVYRTDRDGTILVSSDGATYGVKTVRGTGGIFQNGTGGQTSGPSQTPLTPAVPPLPIRLTATQFDAPGDDRLNLNGEYVVLSNSGDEPVLLAGWTLSDMSGSALYTFPPFILLPDRSVTVYTGPGTFNDTSLFMGKEVPVWGNSGDEAVLKDISGTVIDRKAEGRLG